MGRADEHRLKEEDINAEIAENAEKIKSSIYSFPQSL